MSVLASKARAQANDGADQTVREESEVALNGSNSFDPDDGIALYRWKQVAGASVTFSDPAEDRVTFEAPSFDDSGDQPLIFELIVTDSGGLQSSDSTTVSVSNFEKDNPGASGGGCFIATAASGSPMHYHLTLLARIFHELLSRDHEDCACTYNGFHNTYPYQAHLSRRVQEEGQ